MPRHASPNLSPNPSPPSPPPGPLRQHKGRLPPNPITSLISTGVPPRTRSRTQDTGIMPSPLWLRRPPHPFTMWSLCRPCSSTLRITFPRFWGLSHHTRASNCRPNNFSSPTGLPPQPPRNTSIRPQQAPIPSWVWESLLREGSTRCAQGKATSGRTPHRTTRRPISPVRYAPELRKPSCMPFYPTPLPPIRDPASCKGSQTLPLMLQSGPISSCSLPWLSLFVPLILASLPECPRLFLPFTLPQTRSFPLPPHPPLAVETSWWFILSFISYGCFVTIISRYGGIGFALFVSFVDC